MVYHGRDIQHVPRGQREFSFAWAEFYGRNKINCHVSKQKSNYDLIVGRDVLRVIGIILDFANDKIIWEELEIPMKPLDCTKKEHFATSDSVRVHNETQRIKKILDAKYQKANLSGLVHN